MKIGLVGCGVIAKLGHLPALGKINEVDVVAVVDENIAAAKSLARKFKVKHYYQHLDQLLKNENIDTVVITTPTPSHVLIATESAKAGKNIVIEKPLAMTLKECFAIQQAIKNNNVLLSIIQNYRYYSSAQRAKYQLLQGYYGRPVTFHGIAQTRYPSSWTGGTWLYHERGALLDFTPHLVDALLWQMNSKPKSVFAVGGDSTKSSGFINYANMLVSLENDVSGFLETSWLTNCFAFELEIKGTGGSMKLDINRDHFEELIGPQTPLDDVNHFGRYMARVVKEALTGQIFGKGMRVYEDVYLDILKNFKKGKSPIPVEDGIKTISVLDAAYLSIKEGKVVDIKELAEN